MVKKRESTRHIDRVSLNTHCCLSVSYSPLVLCSLAPLIDLHPLPHGGNDIGVSVHTRVARGVVALAVRVVRLDVVDCAAAGARGGAQAAVGQTVGDAACAVLEPV